MKTFRFAPWGIILVAFSACSENTTTTPSEVLQPGTLAIQLTTPNSGLDAGALIVLSFPSVPAQVRAITGLALWGAPVSAATDTIALTGVLSTGTLVELDIADVALADQYSATLLDVAASGNFALRDLTGYSLSVTR